MLFNSLEYLVFLPVVVMLYWFIIGNNLKAQNLFILAASYFFYGWWSWKFLVLLIASTILDYIYGFLVQSGNRVKSNFFLALSVINNLGILFLFKYYDFFVVELIEGLNSIDVNVSLPLLKFALPIGISFYTFHGMSYVFDIYKSKQKPVKNFVNYAVFVSFFPLLVAGPIERATHLLPQISQKRLFNSTIFISGLRQILWGLFKKVVIADNCAEYANMIFNGYSNYSGSMLLFGALMFTFQIYGDFSGYSDIASGSAKLLGFNLIKNFNYPYFSRDIGEFWRRWHISLSSWFRDYLYIPLGGSKGGTLYKVRNTFIIFIVSGFWHGANWTFLFWGFLNGLYFLPLLLKNRNRKNLDIVQGKYFCSVQDALNIMLTFSLTVIAWIFFRSEKISDAFDFLLKMVSKDLFVIPEIPVLAYPIILLVMLLFVVEWFGREGEFGLDIVLSGSKYKHVRWFFYYILVILILVFQGKEQQFIYFQF